MRQVTLGHMEISQRGRSYVQNVLDSNRLSRGYFTDKFERGFAQMHGCDYGVFCNSGTSALQIALMSLKEEYGFKDGDEVLVPATTFIATSNVVIQCGLTPVFVDVDPATFNIDINKAVISNKTRAIIPVHLFGLPADMESVMGVAYENKLKVIEDSCECVGGSINGKSVGSFGDLACFSTYVAHHIAAGIGGVVTTNDPVLAELCRSYMTHGRDNVYMSIDDDNTDELSVLSTMVERRYNFERVGYSYRATELEAAIALSELEAIKLNLDMRKSNAACLTYLLGGLEHLLQTPYIPKGYDHTFMMYPMVLSPEYDLQDFLLHLEKNGIETRLMFPLLSQPVYRELFPGLENKYPVSQKLTKQGFFIGCHQGLVFEDLQYVSNVIRMYFKDRS